MHDPRKVIESVLSFTRQWMMTMTTLVCWTTLEGQCHMIVHVMRESLLWDWASGSCSILPTPPEDTNPSRSSGSFSFSQFSELQEGMMETYCIFRQCSVTRRCVHQYFQVHRRVPFFSHCHPIQCLILYRGHHPIRYVHVNIKFVLNQRRLNMITCNHSVIELTPCIHVELAISVYSDCYLLTIRIHM